MGCSHLGVHAVGMQDRSGGADMQVSNIWLQVETWVVHFWGFMQLEWKTEVGGADMQGSNI